MFAKKARIYDLAMRTAAIVVRVRFPAGAIVKEEPQTATPAVCATGFLSAA